MSDEEVESAITRTDGGVTNATDMMEPVKMERGLPALNRAKQRFGRWLRSR